MLIACRDWHRLNRRQYTNQSMLNDLNGIYHANRGIAVLDPAKALPRSRRRGDISTNRSAWSRGATAIRAARSGTSANNYMQLTEKGLTKELGYVGTYGEVIDLVTDIYDATRPAPDQPGDEKIKAQLVKVARARAAMRHPAVDAEGNRVMRLEQIVGWRDSHYPGEMAYGQRPTRDGSALQAAAATLDPHLVGYAQQMIADNQFFASEVHAMSDRAQPLRTTIGRLETPDQYELIKSQPPSPHRLPMSWDQPDFVFSDEEDGVVAIKNGNEILVRFALLAGAARHQQPGAGSLHHAAHSIASPSCGSRREFEPSGLTYTRPNWTNFGFGNGGLQYPGEHSSAHAGEVLPIAKIPDGIRFKSGDESVYAGKGSFYVLSYGDYMIGMNCTSDRTFDIKVPLERGGATELVSQKNVSATETLRVAPRSTVVFYFGK